MEVTFRHALPPRHMRLAWPSEEYFHQVLPKFAQNYWVSEPPYLRDDGTPPDVAREKLDKTMALCTMFKNEAPYLEEWLQYHRLLGVAKVGSARIRMR